MRKILIHLIPRIAWVYLHFVGHTSKIIWLNRPIRENLEKTEKNFIYALWHGRQFFFPWLYRNSKSSTLVSQSQDGEYIARTLHLFDMETVRGSSSRGAYRALVELKKMIQSGRTVAVTPDGPRGPKRTIAPGILFLAKSSNKPILPITYSAKRKLIFKGWDDYWVPLPFNIFYINYGEPVWIKKTDDLPLKHEELAKNLNQITEEADRLASS